MDTHAKHPKGTSEDPRVLVVLDFLMSSGKSLSKVEGGAALK